MYNLIGKLRSTSLSCVFYYWIYPSIIVDYRYYNKVNQIKTMDRLDTDL